MRALLKVLLAVVIGLVLLGVSLYLYIFKMGGAEKIVNAQLSSRVEQRYNLDVTIGNISGDLLSGIVLEDVLVYYVDSSNHYLLLDLSRLTAEYSLSNLWEKRYAFDFVQVDSAVVNLYRDITGRWLLPDFSSGPGSGVGTGQALSFFVEDLRINHSDVHVYRREDTLGFTDITLVGAVEGREQTYSLDLGQLSFVSSEDSTGVSAAGGQVTYSDGNLVFQDVEVVANETRIKLDGTMKLRDALIGQVHFALDNVVLADLSDFMGVSLSGTLDLNGTVNFTESAFDGSATIAGDFMLGTFENLLVSFHFENNRLELDTLYGSILGNCTIDGRGEIDFSDPDPTYHLNAQVKNFNLERLVANSFESDLTGSLELSGESFSSDRLLLRLRTELHESSFAEYPLHEVSGDLLITTDSISFADSFRVNYFENVFYVSGGINYTDDIDLHVVADLQNLDRYKGKLFIDQPGGRGYAEATLTGRTADPDLHAVFVSDSVWIYGLYSDSLSATVDLRRFLTGRQGTIELAFLDGSAWNLQYDTGYVQLAVDSDLVQLDTVSIGNEFSHVTASGSLDYGTDPMRLSVDSLTLSLYDQTFYNNAAIECQIDSSGFNFLRACISSDGTGLSAAGRINYDESLSLSVEVDSVLILPWLSLFDTSVDINGRLSCKTQLEGTFQRPRFTLSGSIDSLVYRDLFLGTLAAGVRYDNRQLVLDSVLVRSTEGSYRGSGYFHADLAFTSSVVERFPDLPMNVSIAATDRSFDLVSFLLPSVEQLDGYFSANFILSGTPHAPHLEGQAYIKKARLKYFDLEEPIFADSAGVSMTNNRIRIDRIELYAKDRRRGSRKRYVYVEGEIVVKSLDNFAYDLDVTLAKEFPFSYELEDIWGVVEGDLHIEGDSPPAVTGDLTIVSARYQANFATEQEGSPIMSALSGENTWDLNINIDILSNFWIKNSDLDAEFSGQVNFIRENGVYRFLGEMEILRGKGFLFDKTFRIEPSSQVVFEGNPAINPRLDIQGKTRIAQAASPTEEEFGRPSTYELCIQVTGTLETPEINPCPESDFAREDILPLLVANYYSSESGQASGGIGQRLSGLISAQVAQIGARKLGQLGVETFEIDPVYAGESDPLKARVTVGFYTAPNLYVYGRSTLSGQTRQEVGFEYRFNKAFLLEGLRDEEELYHLALKLHWEF